MKNPLEKITELAPSAGSSPCQDAPEPRPLITESKMESATAAHHVIVRSPITSGCYPIGNAPAREGGEA